MAPKRRNKGKKRNSLVKNLENVNDKLGRGEGSEMNEPDSDTQPPPMANLTPEAGEMTAVGLEGCPRGALAVILKTIPREEYETVAEDLRRRIEQVLDEHIEEYLTAKACFETTKVAHDHRIRDLEEQLKLVTGEKDEFRTKVDLLASELDEVNKRLTVTAAQLNKHRDDVQSLEKELEKVRRDRDVAVDEKQLSDSMIERRETELERLRGEVTLLNQELRSAVNAKCEAINLADDVQAKQVELEFREKRFESERTVLNQQIVELTSDLSRASEELSKKRREATGIQISLETKISEKDEEIRISKEQIVKMTALSEELELKIDELSHKLKERSAAEEKLVEGFQQEIKAQTKLAELYKDRFEESENKSVELAGAVKELQKLLQEASQQCGEFESKLQSAEEESQTTLESKQEAIVALKEELRHANILLEAVKQESSEAAVSRLSPMAASASKLLKSGLTLTQLYTKYAETMQELVVEKNENQNLKAYLEKIHLEIEERAPVLKKQQEDYNYALNMMETLGQKVDELETEHARLVRTNAEIEATNSFLLRENKRFKSTISDLSRQVCFLLREVEAARGNILPLHGQNGGDEPSRAEEITSSEVISKHLVTFKDVQELQLNNQKLLVAIRELSADRDEIEMGRESERITELKSEIQMAQSRIDDLIEREKCLQKVVEVVKSQRDVYQRQYNQLKRGIASGDSAYDATDESTMDDATGNSSPVNKSSPSKLDAARKELQDKQDKNSAILDELRKDFATYRKETQEDKRMLQETINKLRDDLSVATKSKVELGVKAEFYQEKVKSLCAKVKSQGVELSALEKRCKNYVESNGRFEFTVQQLREEAMSALSKLSVAEVTVNNLKQENQILKDNERRMMKEREFERKSKHGQELVMATLETLRVKFESSETEGRHRLEARLDDVTKECTALRRRLQDEQDRLSRRAELLENQMATAKQRLDEEKSLRAKVVEELDLARAQIKERDSQIEHVQEQLSEAIHRSQPVLDRENRIKELETTIKEKETTIAGLMQQLAVARKCQQELSEVSQGVEKQLTEVSEEYDAFKNDAEKKIQEMKKTENELKTTILNLELKLRTSDAEETEIRAQREAELTSLRSRVESLTVELETAKSSVETLSREAREAERQAQEAQETSSQSQTAANALRHELDEARESLRNLETRVIVVTGERDRNIDSTRLDKESLAAKLASLESKVAEGEERIRDLSSVNDLLHSQIQELGSKVAIMDSARSIGETLESADPSTSEFRESDKFLEVLRLLRKEKSAALAASDSLKTENLRLMSEVEVLKRQLDEAKQSLESERNSSDAPSIAAERHTQLLAKVETLNQLLENNKTLREDREQLTSRLNALQNEMSQLEENVMDPAKMKIAELESKIEQISTENTALKAESQRWRDRANELIEKTNKNPEEMKRLLLEKDNLTKLLAAEKDQSRIFKVKLEEQMEKLKKDKEVLLVAHANLEKSLTAAKQELTVVKEACTKATEKATKLEQDVATQETTLADIRNKELQIRQIAKKYKQQYQELAKVMDEKNRAGTSAEEAEEKLKSLAEQMTSLESTVENLRRENESLKAGVVEREDRAKSLLKNARSRVQLLTEENKNLSKELAEAKRTKVQSEGQSTSESNRSLDSRILRLEKEKEEEMEEKERLARELEVVTQRMAIMQRQLDKQQQLTKPSTSSGEKSSSDTPTANIKPLAGPSTSSSKQTQPQQAVTVNPWRETPFASVRPQLSRTVVVLPTSQTTSTSSIPVLVPPQQQVVHTSSTCEGLSSSPTSSHMDYVPASSSAVHNLHQQSSSGVTVIMAQHMEAEAGGADDSAPTQQAPTHCVQPNQNVLHKAQAFVLPQPAQQQPEQPQADVVSAENTGVVSASNQEQVSEQSVTASAVGPLYCPWPADDSSGPVASSQGEGTSSAGSAVAGSGPSGTQSNLPGCSSGTTAASSQQAASSTTSVTTSIAPALKRANPAVDDADSKQHMPAKRSRLVLSGNDSSELLLRSDGLEVEYQVPTSSQRDQEDDILVISDEDELPDDGTMEDGQEFEEVEEEGVGYGIEDYARDSQDMAMPSYEDPDGPNIDERSSSEDYNEVDIDDSNEVPNQSEATRSGGLQSGSSGSAIVEGSSVAMGGEPTSSLGSTTSGQEYQTRRRVGHHTIYISHDDAADDSIVPSTPTLFVPRRTDGFAEAVSSPHVPSGRFTFTDSANSSTSRVPVVEVARLPSEPIDDTRMDLGQLDEGTGRSVPTTPSHLSPQEPVGPEIGQSSSQELVTGELGRCEGSSVVHDSVMCEQQDVGSEDNCDGVSSEGEKVQVPSGLTGGPSSSPSDPDQDLDELEGREAEASPTAVNRLSTAASSSSATTTLSPSVGPGRSSVARRAIRLSSRTTSPSSRGGGGGGGSGSTTSSSAVVGSGGVSGASVATGTSAAAMTSTGVTTARSNPPTPIVWSNEPLSAPLQPIPRDVPYSLNPLSRGRGVGTGRVEPRPSSGYRGGRPRRGRGQPFHHGNFGPRF